VTCDEVDDLIEAVAEGDRPGAEVDAHLAACPGCANRLASAQALHRTLAARETPAPPPGFSARVMQRVGEEHWRAEQIVDLGFNIAIAAGVALMVAGAVAMIWSFGWLTVDRPTIEAVGAVVQPWVARLSDDLRTLGMAALLLTSALALWWWVEGESPL
jgi:predicted anti-sigma-YlaC factor YlaD